MQSNLFLMKVIMSGPTGACELLNVVERVKHGKY